MPIDTVDIFGSDQVGIHLASVGNVLFHPPELPAPTVEAFETCLGLELHPISIGGSSLVGALVCGNSKGIAVADIATEGDIDQLTAFGDVVVMEGGVNTAGNLLVVNEQGAIASPSIPHEGLEILAEVLAVDVAATTVAGQDVVGAWPSPTTMVSSCILTSRPMRRCSLRKSWCQADGRHRFVWLTLRGRRRVCVKHRCHQRHPNNGTRTQSH